MIEGTIIGESIRVGAEVGGVRLVSRRIWRSAQGDTATGQPEVWTLIEFECDEREADALAAGLAAALEKTGGWYADFRSPAETFVVYADKVFRYPRGDSEGRAEAMAYGRAAGVPEDELDWPV